jgi:hypothetical protein
MLLLLFLLSPKPNIFDTLKESPGRAGAEGSEFALRGFGCCIMIAAAATGIDWHLGHRVCNPPITMLIPWHLIAYSIYCVMQCSLQNSEI